jgi:hypothetical protein
LGPTIDAGPYDSPREAVRARESGSPWKSGRPGGVASSTAGCHSEQQSGQARSCLPLRPVAPLAGDSSSLGEQAVRRLDRDLRFAIASPERRRRTKLRSGLKKYAAAQQMTVSLAAPPGVLVCVDAVTRFA